MTSQGTQGDKEDFFRLSERVAGQNKHGGQAKPSRVIFGEINGSGEAAGARDADCVGMVVLSGSPGR